MPIKIIPISESKSSSGIIRQKKVRIENTDPKEGIGFESVQKIYSELLKKYRANNISITGMFMDGGQKQLNKESTHTTLKKYDNTNEILNLADEEYYSSVPVEKRDKFKRFYSLDIYIKNPYRFTKI